MGACASERVPVAGKDEDHGFRLHTPLRPAHRRAVRHLALDAQRLRALRGRAARRRAWSGAGRPRPTPGTARTARATWTCSPTRAGHRRPRGPGRRGGVLRVAGGGRRAGPAGRPQRRRLGPRRQAGRRARLADARPRPAIGADLVHHRRRRARGDAGAGARRSRVRHAQGQARVRRRSRPGAAPQARAAGDARSATTPTRGGTASVRPRPSRPSRTSTRSSSSSRCRRPTPRASPGSRSARASRCSPTRRC